MSATNQGIQATPPRLSRNWLLFALSLVAFIINIDYMAVNLSLVVISEELQSELSTVQWVLSSYALAWAAIVVPAGKLSDVLSKRQICLFGLVMFILASTLAGIASSIQWLIIARILQGLAGAFYIPATYALVYEYFPEDQRGKAMGMISVGVGVGAALGPSMGGLCLELFGWRSIFLMVIPPCLIACAIIHLSTQYTKVTVTYQQMLPQINALNLAVILVGTMYTLSQWKQWPIYPEFYQLTLTGALILIIYFIYKERTAPLIPPSLRINPSFIAICTAIALEQYGFSNVIVIAGLYLQKVQLYSITHTSLIYLAMTGLSGLVGIWAGRFIDRTGVKKSAIAGLLMMVMGVLLFTQLSPLSSLGFITITFALIGLGMGLSLCALNTGIVKVVAPEEVGVASSFFLLMALMGNACGVTFATMLYEKINQQALMTWLYQTLEQPTTPQISALNHYVSHIGQTHMDFNLFDPEIAQMLQTTLPTLLNRKRSTKHLVLLI